MLDDDLMLVVLFKISSEDDINKLLRINDAAVKRINMIRVEQHFKMAQKPPAPPTEEKKVDIAPVS